MTYPNTGGNTFWPVGESLSGSCEGVITRDCDRGTLPKEALSFWAAPTPMLPCGPWPSVRLGLWRLCPQIEFSSDSLRPPGEAMEPLRTVLHWGVWQNFLQIATTIVQRITVRQREIPTTTTTLLPKVATPTALGERDGEGSGKAVEEVKTIMLECASRNVLIWTRWRV